METINILKTGENKGQELYQSKYSFFTNSYDFILEKGGRLFRRISTGGEESLQLYTGSFKIVDNDAEIKQEAEIMIIERTKAFLNERGGKVSVSLKHPEKGYVRGSNLDSFTNVEYFAEKYVLTPEFCLEYLKKGIYTHEIFY